MQTYSNRAGDFQIYRPAALFSDNFKEIKVMYLIHEEDQISS
mgnify:CR=1 FL=1